MSQSVTVASWNINSVRFRMDIVERFLREHAPDILCLQETKVKDEQFPETAFAALGYTHQALHGQPMHHGVATLSKIPMRNITRYDWQDNGEARHVGIELTGPRVESFGRPVRLDNVYIPAGGDMPDREANPKFGQKLDFLTRMTHWSQQLDTPTMIVGDFNIAPLESDVWSHKQLLKTVSHTPIEVEHLDRLQAAHDWRDIGRKFIPAPERLYTWWSYRARDWAASDKGRRLDHMWVSPTLEGHVRSHKVVEDCRGWTKPSDHAPLISELVF